MQLHKVGCVAAKCRLKKDDLSAMSLCALHNSMLITVSSHVG